MWRQLIQRDEADLQARVWPIDARSAAYGLAVLHLATVLGLRISDSMKAGYALVAAGAFLLAIFAALSAFEAIGAVKESRDVDALNARRAEYRRSREIGGVARLIDQKLVMNRDIAEDARHDGQWFVSSGTTHHAWDTNAAVIMEEVDEDIAAKLVALFSEVVAMEGVRCPQRSDKPTSSLHSRHHWRRGVRVAERVTDLAPACVRSLRALT